CGRGQADHRAAQSADLESDTAAPREASWVPGRLEGITVVRGSGFAVDTTPWKDRLYRPIGRGSAGARRRTTLTAIPYYAWANRGPGAMRGWIPRSPAGSAVQGGRAARRPWLGPRRIARRRVARHHLGGEQLERAHRVRVRDVASQGRAHEVVRAAMSLRFGVFDHIEPVPG